MPLSHIKPTCSEAIRIPLEKCNAPKSLNARSYIHVSTDQRKMFQFYILCMKTSMDLFRARIPLGLKTSHCTATLCNPMRMILQPYRQSVGNCWVRLIVYLYGPTLIECGLICHCRKCDSNELKGSASTSLMKAIIHSNNVGAALGAAPSVVASHPQQPVGTAGLPGSPAFMPTSSNYPSKSVYNPQQLQGHGGPHHRPPQQPQLPSSLPQPNQQLNNMAMMSGKFRLLVEFNSSPRLCFQFQQVTNGAVVLELDHCVHRLNLRSLFWWTKLVHQDFRKP